MGVAPVHEISLNVANPIFERQISLAFAASRVTRPAERSGPVFTKWSSRIKKPCPREKAQAPPCADQEMEILCPHCGHAEADAFELIEVNALHDDFVCARCRQGFVARIRNCIRCDFEQALTWRLDSVPDAVAELPCGHCGHIELQLDARDDL
jgi:transcription elongation factor Elf1